ncbi:hypothetical protein HD554DRAFT_2032574, partial [Boletus coccyginus]
MPPFITGAEFYRNPPKNLVVQREGFVFTSPTAQYEPPSALEDVLHDPDWIGVDQPFQFRFNLKKYPQFAFIPKDVQFFGPLLGRLARYKVEQRRDGLYALDSELLASWVWLEDTLAAAISCICSRIVLPMDVHFYPYPKTFGYRRTYRSKKRAIMTAKVSRDAFVVMIGLLSM